MTLQPARLLETEVLPYKVGSRTESAALIAWFLETAWRAEPEDVPDSICDGPADKGIDAIHVDEDLSEISIIQAKWRLNHATSTQGDNDLKTLVGTASYFESPQTVDALVDSGINAELRKLLTRQAIREKIELGAYTIKLTFITNAELDSAAESYLATRATLSPSIQVFTGKMLNEIAERTRRPSLRGEAVKLKAASAPTIADLTDSEKMAIALVQATELVKLPGISDHSLFSRNVRLFAGRTRINNELRDTVLDSNEHRLFPAFHNGLTLLTEKLEAEGDELLLNGVGVVNGCQSLITLYENSNSITDSLKLLVKVVEVPSDSKVADNITYRSNNQNTVTLRDQRSSDKVLRDLQLAVQQTFGNEFYFKIKLGETGPRGAQVLENTLAAQLIMAVFLKEPWAAVRKVRLFDQDFRRIFSRSITPYALYLLSMINGAVEESRQQLRPDLTASFSAIRFTLAYLIGQVLRESEPGDQLLADPARWLAQPEVRQETKAALEKIALEVVDSANYFIETELEESEEFDPKIAFKSQSGVRRLNTDAVRDARRQRGRDGSYLFSVSPISQTS